jgi:hypothetical protein
MADQAADRRFDSVQGSIRREMASATRQHRVAERIRRTHDGKRFIQRQDPRR